MSARFDPARADPTWRAHGLLTVATTGGGSSFLDFLGSAAPELLPRAHPDAALAPHGTTIVAALYADGVVLAGDRRATMGNLIAQRDIDKVFATDDYSLVGIAGTAGTAIEIVRLFQVELEHYEKIEGTQLTLDGKANRLSTMIRGNLGAAMQGLAVVPLFAGYDIAGVIAADTASGNATESEADTPGDGSAADGFVGPARIYSYDVTGGRYPEKYYHSVGSGSVFAKGSLKKLWRPDMSRAEIIRVVVAALYDAADDDSATGGPDVRRGIYPVVRIATAAGTERVADAELADVVTALIAERTEQPGS